MADLISESQTTNPGAIVELFEIDYSTRLSTSGSGPTKTFLTNEQNNIVFNGDTYISTTIDINAPNVGLDLAPGRGTLTIYGQNTQILAAINGYIRIRGATVLFKQTHSKFLDTGSEPDPTQVFVEKYIIEAIKERSKNKIELDLSIGISLLRLTQPAIQEVSR